MSGDKIIIAGNDQDDDIRVVAKGDLLEAMLSVYIKNDKGQHEPMMDIKIGGIAGALALAFMLTLNPVFHEAMDKL